MVDSVYRGDVRVGPFYAMTFPGWWEIPPPARDGDYQLARDTVRQYEKNFITPEVVAFAIAGPYAVEVAYGGEFLGLIPFGVTFFPLGVRPDAPYGEALSAATDWSRGGGVAPEDLRAYLHQAIVALAGVEVPAEGERWPRPDDVGVTVP